MKIIIKLGGSVVTFKETKDFPLSWKEIERTCERYIRVWNVRRIAKEIASITKITELQMILINGAGPFGHFLVKERLEGNKSITTELIHKSVELLNQKIVRIFNDNGMKLVPLAPYELCYFSNGMYNIQQLYTKCLRVLSEGGFPSTYGDCVKVNKQTPPLGDCVVISGDDLVVELTKLWRPDKVIIATDVDGVFTSDPKLNPDARLIRLFSPETLESTKFEISSIDVTGGMRSKVIKLLSISSMAECRIINGLKPGIIRKAILGYNVGTLIKGNLHPNSLSEVWSTD